MYTLIELLHGLPWANCNDKDKIAMYKETVTDDQVRVRHLQLTST